MIRISDISKKYKRRKVLENISFELLPGEILAMMGPSGCGKTTLLRIIAGFETPDEGKIEIDGKIVATPAHGLEPHKRNVSMVFQELAIWPHMNAAAHLEFALSGRESDKNAIRSNTDELLRKVGLEGFAHRYPRELSGGEKQRLAIARAMAPNAKYLLMDEPFSNLDSRLKEELQALLVSLKEGLGIGIVYVTHNKEEAFAVGDRMVFMGDSFFIT